MIEDWIDQVAKAFGTLTDGSGHSLTSYRVFEKAEIPSALGVFPCAISYTPDVDPRYAAGAIDQLIWTGTTEIHVTSAMDPALVPSVLKYFTWVLKMMTTNRTLSGKVQYFMLPEKQKSIHFALLKYGQEPAHYGLIVDWEVCENVSLPLSG